MARLNELEYSTENKTKRSNGIWLDCGCGVVVIAKESFAIIAHELSVMELNRWTALQKFGVRMFLYTYFFNY